MIARILKTADTITKAKSALEQACIIMKFLIAVDTTISALDLSAFLERPLLPSQHNVIQYVFSIHTYI